MIESIFSKIEGVIVFKIDQFHDDRGSFLEIFNKEKYKLFPMNIDFKQDSLSISKNNVLRGLHYRKNKPQAQLLTVLKGTIFDVVVDLRKDSLTYGQWQSNLLEDKKNKQIYMPAGIAHGFYVISDEAILSYKMTEIYDKNDDYGIIWNDDKLNIRWPCDNPIISQKDKKNDSFKII